MSSEIELGDGHGRKRPVDDNDLEGEQRLTKRLNRLQIDHKLLSRLNHVASASRDADPMHIDETKDKIYIHDLDAELAEIEDDSPKIEFLPEIEKKLAAFPSLLETRALSPSQGQLVLYRPMSLPDEIHNARKAILASRRRSQEENNKNSQSNEIRSPSDNPIEIAHPIESIETLENDPDAMDIG